MASRAETSRPLMFRPRPLAVPGPGANNNDLTNSEYQLSVRCVRTIQGEIMTGPNRLVRGCSLVGIFGLVAMGVAACGSSSKPKAASTGTTAASTATTGSASAMPQAIVDAANKEGQVEVYNVDSTDEVTAVQAAWAKAYPGIKLNYDRLSPAEVEARVTAELSSGLKADLVDLADDPFVGGLSAGG